MHFVAVFAGDEDGGGPQAATKKEQRKTAIKVAVKSLGFRVGLGLSSPVDLSLSLSLALTLHPKPNPRP